MALIKCNFPTLTTTQPVDESLGSKKYDLALLKRIFPTVTTIKFVDESLSSKKFVERVNIKMSGL